MLSSLRSRLTARLWPLPSLLVSLVLIGTASIQIWLQPYDGLYWSSATGQVTVIDQDGPAAAAGMQVGDYVLAINGTLIRYISYPYTRERIGDTVTFSFLRGNEPRDAESTLQAAAPSVFLSRLEPVLIGVAPH